MINVLWWDFTLASWLLAAGIGLFGLGLNLWLFWRWRHRCWLLQHDGEVDPLAMHIVERNLLDCAARGCSKSLLVGLALSRWLILADLPDQGRVLLPWWSVLNPWLLILALTIMLVRSLGSLMELERDG